MNTKKANIANHNIIDLTISVALLLLKMIGLDPTKNPKAQKALAQNIKPRLARNLRKDRVDKIRIGTTTGYKKYRPTGEISELKVGTAVADFVCDEYGLPLKEHPSLLTEYNNLVLFYESLFGKCCEPHAIGNLLSGRINRRQKKSESEKPSTANKPTSSEGHRMHHKHRGVQLESEDDQQKPEFDLNDISE